MSLKAATPRHERPETFNAKDFGIQSDDLLYVLNFTWYDIMLGASVARPDQRTVPGLEGTYRFGVT